MLTNANDMTGSQKRMECLMSCVRILFRAKYTRDYSRETINFEKFFQ